MTELVLPEEIRLADATEFLRAWIEGENIGFTSLGNIFEDSAMIGIFASDIVRHLVASGPATEEEKEHQLTRAVAAFRAEFE